MEANTLDEQIYLESIPEKISEVESLVDRLRDTHQISGEVYGNILIALTEAVNNAIIHGNQCDVAKKVMIAY